MAYELLKAGMLSIVPALATLFVAYGRFEGQFRDNQVFLFFIGGLAMGLFLGVVEAFLVAAGAALLTVFGMAFLEQLAKGVVVNMRRFQGTASAVFLGGSFGLGLGTMLAMRRAFGFFLAAGTEGTVPWLQLAVTCPAIVLFHYGTGIVIGDGVRERRFLVPLTIAGALGVPVRWAFFEYDSGLAFLWLVVIALFGVGVAVFHSVRTLPNGASEEWRRERRRRVLQSAR